jgi:hypothetical protein
VEENSLRGAWELSKNGGLTFSLDNGNTIKYQILSIDENNLIMERKSSTFKVLNYTDLSVCGEFTDNEVAKDTKYYSVARSVENGDCLFLITNMENSNDSRCFYDKKINQFAHSRLYCMEGASKFYNLQGQEIEEEEIAASKPISQEEYKHATAK